MKNLEHLIHRAQTAILAPHYAAFLEPEDRDKLVQLQKKKSISEVLGLLRQIALRAIQALRRSPYFWGEPKWQSSFALYETQLQDTTMSLFQNCIILCNVDDLITIAHVMHTVRQDIWETVKLWATLSHEEQKKYNAVQKYYGERRERLMTIEKQVAHIEAVYSARTGQSHSSNHSTDVVITQSMPRELPHYHQAALQTRFSKEHVQHLVQVEGNARIVYQDLAREIDQPSAVEKLTQEIKLGEKRLNDKAEKIIQAADKIQDRIRQDSCQLIEHRAQTIIAHANRVEQTILILQKIIQRLDTYLFQLQKIKNSFLEKRHRPLILLIQEAKSAQDYLHSSSQTMEVHQVQQHVLAMENYRKKYVEMITGWSSLFRKKSVSQGKDEKINQEIQSDLAELVIPICGLHDKQGIATAEQIKDQQVYHQQLSNQVDLVHSETKKLRN